MALNTGDLSRYFLKYQGRTSASLAGSRPLIRFKKKKKAGRMREGSTSSATDQLGPDARTEDPQEQKTHILLIPVPLLLSDLFLERRSPFISLGWT